MEQYIKLIKVEATFQELKDSLEDEIKVNESYYDLSLLLNGCYKRINEEIDDKYFSLWLKFMSLLLNVTPYEEISSILRTHSDKSIYSLKDVYKLLHILKEYDLRINHPNYIDYHIVNNMQVIYLSLLPYREGNEVDLFYYRMYVVNHLKKTFNVFTIEESSIKYDLNQTYIFLDNEKYINVNNNNIIEEGYLTKLLIDKYKKDNNLQE